MKVEEILSTLSFYRQLWRFFKISRFFPLSGNLIFKKTENFWENILYEKWRKFVTKKKSLVQAAKAAFFFLFGEIVFKKIIFCWSDFLNTSRQISKKKPLKNRHISTHCSTQVVRIYKKILINFYFNSWRSIAKSGYIFLWMIASVAASQNWKKEHCAANVVGFRVSGSITCI
jgi:hypothetical protein